MNESSDDSGFSGGADVTPRSGSWEHPGYAAARRRCLWALLAFAIVMGIAQGRLPDGEPSQRFYTLSSLGLAALGLAWCYFDSRAGDHILGTGLTLLILCVGILAVPAYLISSRGWRRGGVATAQALGFFVLLAVVNYLAAWGTLTWQER